MTLAYNNRSRRLSDDGEIFGHAFRHNPLLSAAAGASLIAGGCTSLGSSVMLCIFMLVLLPLIGYVSAVEMERIRPHLRAAVYCAGAAAVILLLSLLMDSAVIQATDSLGIFAPLTAVSSLVLARTADEAPILTRREATLEGLACTAVFAVIALPVGFIRELLGRGELFGQWLGFSGTDVLSRPFVGFILCGFAAAIIRRASEKPARAAGTEGGSR